MPPKKKQAPAPPRPKLGVHAIHSPNLTAHERATARPSAFAWSVIHTDGTSEAGRAASREAAWQAARTAVADREDIAA